MTQQNAIDLFQQARWYDLTQPLSIFTPPWPGEMPLQVHFFKRLTGAWGGGQGANGQLIEWSNNTGTHLVGPRAFHSGMRSIADIPLSDLMGEGVIVDISDAVSDYSLYTPEMITSRADVRAGDILIVNTGYHRYAWDQPDVANLEAQGGVENKEFGYYLRHPGPSPEFFQWALDMKLKLIGVDCGSAEHPMNTSLRTMHPREFEKAEAKLQETHGKSWDELFPPEWYHELTHITLPRAGLLLAESLGGEIDQLNNERAWIMVGPIPFMEVESAWARVAALQAPEGMSQDDFATEMANVEMTDMTLPFSVQTPQWANYEPLSVKYTKRVGGQYFGLGRNNAHCRASFHLATHMDGERHFHAAGRTIGEMPFDYWFGPGVVADISEMVSNSSVYTPAMVESVVDVQPGDILIVKTGWYRYGWSSPDSDEFRYMIKHPGPSPDFAAWCVEKEIKWLGVDCVAMEHPMNTIQRQWHPKTFEEANEKLIEQYGKDWDEMYPLDKYYQDMHLNLFPKGIVHAENLGHEIADLESGRYFIACFIQRGVELASCWGRFVTFGEGG
ncbi:MAG: cyclase family protein [Candidatus Promineifilaceae bacterium]|nr:cyclase family protein [Candidatus Promineifilaceae bacterium]